MNYDLFRDGRQTRIHNAFRLKRMWEAGEVDATDMVRREGEKRYRQVGEVLGFIHDSDPRHPWRNPLPNLPPVSWWVALILGALTFGYATYVIGAIQAFWSRRIERRWAPVILASISVLTPPVHMVWIVRSLVHVRHSLREALIDLLVGFIAAEIAAALFTALGSLSVRRSLTRKLEEFGFRMNWIFTALFGPIYVAYALEELRNSYR